MARGHLKRKCSLKSWNVHASATVTKRKVGAESSFVAERMHNLATGVGTMYICVQPIVDGKD